MDFTYFFFRFLFGFFFAFIFDRTVFRQEIKWGRERGGMGSGKVREPGLELRTPKAQQRFMPTDFTFKYNKNILYLSLLSLLKKPTESSLSWLTGFSWLSSLGDQLKPVISILNQLRPASQHRLVDNYKYS